MYIFYVLIMCFFFFFKQKTAYEIMPSFVGSEMCIRDSPGGSGHHATADPTWRSPTSPRSAGCLLYTSDAADDLLCVDLGGRRIIKKKKKIKYKKKNKHNR